MTTTQQPEALVFADDRPTSTSDDLYQWAIDAEDLIRAQHARIEELEAQLSAIGAGGVEPLRKQAATQAAHPENIREGAPYDNPEFEQLARDMGVWGTPQAALCAQFWLAATPAADAPLVPQGWKPVQIELLERIQESLGSFLSDQGWSQSDMNTADALGGLLAAAPKPPACNLSLQPELATYSAQTRNKKGIEQ